MTFSAPVRSLAALLTSAAIISIAFWPAQAQDPVEKQVGKASVQDALLKPVMIPFGEPTSLEAVAAYLAKTLGIRVAIDRAALDRLEISLKEEVQLELEGVRLKTSLKLLLDQVSMTFKVIPEDNLLIFTDNFGVEDPAERTLAELKALHLEMHDLQDAVDEIRQTLGIANGGARVRKPTIIEEMPEEDGKPVEKPSRSRPGL